MPDPAPHRFHCPWLGREVELPNERELQIAHHHPDLLPRHRTALAEVLADPHVVRRGTRVPTTFLFSRGYAEDGGRRRTVVVVVDGALESARSRILTAYTTRTTAGDGVVWRRD